MRTERLTVVNEVTSNLLQLGIPSILFGGPRHHSPDFDKVSNRFSQARDGRDAIHVWLIGGEVVTRRTGQIVKHQVHFSLEGGNVFDVFDDLRCPPGPIEADEVDPAIGVAFLKVDVFGQRVVLLKEGHVATSVPLPAERWCHQKISTR